MPVWCPERGELKCLLKKKREDKTLARHGRDGGVSGVLDLPKSID
jgi:hypothetical protein